MLAASGPAPAPAAEAPPRPSRTRLTRGPKIITIPSKSAPPETGGATEAKLILPRGARTAALTL
jgi:hypothetical protein